MILFLQRPSPFQDESLESFFIRVANRNGYKDVHKFLLATKKFLLDLDATKYQFFPTDITLINPYSSLHHSTARTHCFLQLSQMTFNEPADILTLAINRSQLKFSPNHSALIRKSEVIPRSLLKTSIPCCPECLLEDGYATYLWHFSGYETCHKHKLNLIDECQCGHVIDYRKNGLSNTCANCQETIKVPATESPDFNLNISCWLAGLDVKPLPNVSLSHRWGILHWWLKLQEENTLENFITFWNNWPKSFNKLIQDRIAFNLEFAVVSRKQLRLKDLLGPIFFGAIYLPTRDLNSNIILNALFNYLESHLSDDAGLIANLRMSALEVCLVLNCSLEQVASLVDQRLLQPTCPIKSSEPLKSTHYIFSFGDVYCLWLSDFQTPEFNRSYFISRW